MLKDLRLYQFRNIQEQSFEFGPNLNIFVGDNGQGKTNLVEAIYLLATGESFRTADQKHFVARGKTEATIIGNFDSKKFSEKHQFKFYEGKKQFFVDDKRSTFENTIRVVQFNPESLSAVKGSAEQRRALFDEILTQSSERNSQTLRHFRKILKARNKILREIANDPRDVAIQTLFALNEQFILLATQVTWLRWKLIQDIHDELNIAAQNILQTEAFVEIRYMMSGHTLTFEDVSEAKIYENLRSRMQELASAERRMGTSLVGPHKHDVTFLIGSQDSRFFASQGQQRGLILALKLAQIVYYKNLHGDIPILLLDDVLSELDLVRRNALLYHLGRIDTQIFMTTTDLDGVAAMKATSEKIFEIAQGKKKSERFL